MAKIKKAKFFSVLADKVVDVSNKEQTPSVIRYVDHDGSIKEDFLKFIYLETGTAGSTIAERIKKELQELGLDMNNCRGQGYDGTGNMAGRYNGAAALIRSAFPLAIYTHCASHRLNLCVAGACKISMIRKMFGIVKAVHDFFNCPKRNEKLKESIEENFEEKDKDHKTKLIDCCCTRWIQQIESLEVFEKLYTPITFALVQIKDNEDGYWNGHCCVDAEGLWRSCISFEFIITLVVVREGNNKGHVIN